MRAGCKSINALPLKQAGPTSTGNLTDRLGERCEGVFHSLTYGFLHKFITLGGKPEKLRLL